MFSAAEIGRFIVVTGHYGSGKTNLSLNLARDLASRHADVTLVDLDIVNPYFRSSDYVKLLETLGVRLVAPTFAGTTLDTPSLSAGVYGALESAGGVVLDVGGDDVGATALGRFSKLIAGVEHEMMYVINRYRNLTATPAEAAALLPEIERASHLRATGVVNNSHLGRETTLGTVLDSLDFARETADLLGLPLVCTTVPASLAAGLSETPGAATYVENAYPVEVYVRAPWDAGPEEKDV
jgi:energy-coupling factor transporter ATP-binding protein EcfA2